MEAKPTENAATAMPAEDLTGRIRRLETASRRLEAGPERRSEVEDAVRDAARRYLASIPGYVETEDGAKGLLELPIREEATPLDRVIEHVERDVLRPGAHPASPGHLAYLTGGGLYEAALADYLAAATNKFPAVFFTGPGPVRMEHVVIRWTADLVGYPPEAAGHIASGGSLANLAAIATARDAHGIGAGVPVENAVVYLTSQTHHCIDKALRLTGLARAPVRHIPIDDGYRMRPDALAAAVVQDRAAGLTPWLVVATAGTTDAGAVDPLAAVGEVAREAGCWFHVDAAYGGFFRLTESGRALTAGIETSDSVVLDPHKSLFLPWGAGILVVRDGRKLAETHGGAGAYLQDAVRARGQISPAELSPELTKPFRALRIWLPLMLHGVAPFRAALEEKLLLARYFHREIAGRGYETGPEPDLSIATFRRSPDGMSGEARDELNREIVDAVRRDGRIFLTSTELDGRYTIRMAALAHRTHLEHVDLALEILEQEAASR